MKIKVERCEDGLSLEEGEKLKLESEVAQYDGLQWHSPIRCWGERMVLLMAV